jgi:hypothetical protein
MSVRCRLALVAVLLSLVQMLSGPACFGKVSRHDTIIMENGDRFTGEVKRLEQGILYIETDYFSGSVGVDWLQVEKIESTAPIKSF